MAQLMGAFGGYKGLVIIEAKSMARTMYTSTALKNISQIRSFPQGSG